MAAIAFARALAPYLAVQLVVLVLALVVALPPLAHLGRSNDVPASTKPADDDAARKRFNDMLNIAPSPPE